MNQPYSHDPAYLSGLKKIEQQIQQNQLQEAALGLTKLSRNNTKDPRLFLLGSLLASASGNADGTLSAARRASELAPQWHPATIYLAGVLADQGQAEEAVDTAELALQQAAEGVNVSVKELSALAQRAAAIALRFEGQPKAWRWLRDALQADPDDATLKLQMARTLVGMGDLDGAVELFDALLQQQPGHAGILLDRLRARLMLGQLEAARQDADVLLAQAPANPVYQFFAQMAQGKVPKTQPALLVTTVFDRYATRYDQQMTVAMHYKLPKQVAKMVGEWYPDRKFDLLDLGCGTGLLGRELKAIDGAFAGQAIDGELIGADLSEQMIIQAQSHGVYANFYKVNLLDALVATPAEHYAVISALDVFGSVGDLSTVMPGAFRVLTPGGHLVFTFQESDSGDAPYALTTKLNYEYQRDYVQRLLQDSGFTDINMQDVDLRVEEGQAVRGVLVTASKPGEGTEQAPAKAAENAGPDQPA